MLKHAALVLFFGIFLLNAVYAGQDIDVTMTPLVATGRNPVWSEDRQHYAFRNEHEVVVDGLREGPYLSMPSEVRFTPDSKHYFYTVDHDPNNYSLPNTLYMDGKPRCVENEFKLFAPYLMPDGSICCGWRERERSGNFLYALLNGRDIQTRLQYTGNGGEFQSVAMTRDGKHTVYKWDDQVFHDGKPGKKFPQRMLVDRPYIIGQSVAISGDGHHAAYVIQKENKQAVVLDEIEQAAFPSIQMPVLMNDDASVLAYVAVFGMNDVALVENGKAETHYRNISALRISASGKRCDFTASRGNEQFVIVNGIEHSFDHIMFWKLSPDGKHSACSASRKNRRFAVIDGKEGKEYPMVGEITFSPDSAHWIYSAGPTLVCDAREFPEVYCSAAIFSPDSKHWLAYGRNWAQDSSAVLLVDGKKSSVPYRSVAGMVFSSDAKRYAYVAELPQKAPQTTVVVDGIAGPLVYKVLEDWSRPPAPGMAAGSSTGPDVKFSPNGKHVAYIAIVNMNPEVRARLVIDQKFVGPLLRENEPSFQFLGPNTLRAIAMGDNGLVQIDATIP